MLITCDKRRHSFSMLLISLLIRICNKLTLQIFFAMFLNQLKKCVMFFAVPVLFERRNDVMGFSVFLNLSFHICHYGEAFLVCGNARNIPPIAEMCVFVEYSRK